ncbi:MAG TPA: sensor histidine kinase [Actinomycetales bacterium]|nr:sensor histidine kinase [Actinomycetales bacterium]
MSAHPIPRPSRADIAFGVGLTLLLGWWTFTYYLGGFPPVPDLTSLRWVAIGVAALKPLALVWRRSNPVAATLGAFGLSAVHFSLLQESLPTDIVLWIMVYAAAAFGPRWLGLVALAGVTLGSLWVVTMSTSSPSSEPLGLLVETAFLASFGLAAWALGNSTHSRMERLDALEEQAIRLQSDRDQEALLAASAERTRIAREMHDIIAHSLSVIIAQADGGRYAAMADPKAGERALGTISEVGRASLADMRRLLGVLREPSEASSPTTPQPMDADLEELVRGVREAGLRVSLVRMGEPRALPPGAGLTVYRLIQEALTNSMKHAGPNAQVTVLLQWLHSALALEMTDDGRGAAAPSDGRGQGLVGMRERAAIYGGTVSAGPRPGGGFQVKVLIPLPDDRSRPVALGSSVPEPPSVQTSDDLPVIRDQIGAGGDGAREAEGEAEATGEAPSSARETARNAAGEAEAAGETPSSARETMSETAGEAQAAGERPSSARDAEAADGPDASHELPGGVSAHSPLTPTSPPLGGHP